MPLVSLSQALALAGAKQTYCVGFVCQGWEDAQAFVAAGEATGAPVILSAGPGARRHMPVEIWGEIFRNLAENSTAQVVAHLDHGDSLATCQAALDAGFSSVMIDGSALPLADNIKLSQSVVMASESYGSCVEAELGEVGYADGAASVSTNAADVRRFLNDAPVDALAISVGNVHLQTEAMAKVDWDGLSAIADVTDTPLVIHGGSGVLATDRQRMAREYGVRKINIGTELRQAFGASLRDALDQNPDVFDRIKLLTAARDGVADVAKGLLRETWG